MMSPENLGSLIHTSLRKGSDTKWSVLLWNLINLTPKDEWILFLKDIQTCSDGALKDGIVKAAKYDGWSGVTMTFDDDLRRRFSHANHALRAAFQLCDDQTLNDIVTFVEYYSPADECKPS